MAYLSKREAREEINAMSDEDIMELLDSIDVSYDFVNGVLIDKEGHIKRLVGEASTPQNVIITYSYNGEKIVKQQETKAGCKTCGG